MKVKTVPEGTLSALTVIWVVVGVGCGGGGALPPPPHPIVKLSMQISPNPSATRYFFRPPGRNNRNNAAKPVPALSVHHPLPGVVGGIALASNIRSSRASEAVNVVEVAVTMHINWGATGVADTMLMFSGDGVQLTPGGSVAAVGVTATVPVNPPAGVTVTVSGTAAPVAELSTKGCGL